MKAGCLTPVRVAIIRHDVEPVVVLIQRCDFDCRTPFTTDSIGHHSSCWPRIQFSSHDAGKETEAIVGDFGFPIEIEPVISHTARIHTHRIYDTLSECTIACDNIPLCGPCINSADTEQHFDSFGVRIVDNLLAVSGMCLLAAVERVVWGVSVWIDFEMDEMRDCTGVSVPKR